MKHRGLQLAAAAALMLSVTGCTGIEQPTGWGAPVVAGDVIVVNNGQGKITGLRTPPQGGGEPSVAWTFPEDAEESGGFLNSVWRLFASSTGQPNYSAIYATPRVETVDNQRRVYLASYSGDVIALDPANGRPVPGWPERVNVGGHVAATPAFDGKRLFIGTNHGDVRSVDAATGAVSAPIVGTDARVWSAPILDSGTLYVSSLDRRVRAVDPNTKDIRWTAEVGPVAGNPTLNGDMLIVPTLQSQVVALDARSGEQRWVFRGDHWFWARPLVQGDTVVVATTTGIVYGLDLRTGVERWRTPALRGEVRSSPTVVGGVLLLTTRAGVIVGLDPATGTERWRQEVEGARFVADPLVLESGVLYIAEDGSLYRVQQDQGAVTVLLKRG